MKDITLLHIGDIHFKDIDKDDRPVDMKDSQFSKKLDEILLRKSHEIIIETLMEEIGNSPLAILISGDLSTYGEIESYKKCLTFLKERIPSTFFKSEPFHRLFIVPGNHDIDRRLFSEDSVFPKFKPINEALVENNFPEIPCPKVKIEKLPVNSSGTVLIISINSCIGCGERRYYPDKIRNLISGLFNDKDERDEGIRELFFEKIDTPIITEEDIETMVHYVESTDDKCLPIILAHHNLLPQKRPRIEMYTELLNSGYIRERLLVLNRPIIYLHGHIHDDPVEIIRSTKFENSKIICISAPLLFPNKSYKTTKFGFNKIKIIYGHHGIPIGCEIIHYRMNEGTRKMRIRFWDPPKTIALITTEEKNILNSIHNLKNEQIYMGDLKDRVNQENNTNFLIEDIEESVDQLSWLGLVDYSQRDVPLPMRRVEKVVP